MSSLSDESQSYETDHGKGHGTAPGQATVGEDYELSVDSNARRADELPTLAFRKTDAEAEAQPIGTHPRHGRDAATSWESNARQYRKLLNTVIGEATRRTSLIEQPVAPSQIGASHWTSSEKHTLLGNLELYGSTDLLALSRSLPTKTEPEIHVYLKLLQEGVKEARVTQSHTTSSLFEEIPAAHEISPELEASLNTAANALSRKVDLRDARSEQAKYRSGWLIDANYAASVVARRGAVEGDDGDDTPSADEDDEHGESDALTLLRPEALLDLSSTIFMNAAHGSEQNWQELLPADGSIESPAIFRTAFEDLHSLVLSRTRRLVQTSLYQAQTRLRASDASRSNWQPTPEVRENDVRTAIEIVGMQPRWHSYWAKLPERLGLAVYSDVQRYKDGRPGTKTGVKLTAREVDHELGNGASDFVVKTPDVEYDMTLSDFDSDDLTDASQPDSPTNDVSDQSTDPNIDDEKKQNLGSDTERASSHGAKRKRALSSSVLARAEAQYLDHLDQKSSEDEVQRLWNIVGATPGHTLHHGKTTPPKPAGQGDELGSADRWIRKVQYWSPWELYADKLPDSAFVVMNECGLAGRKKRRWLHERLASEGIAPPTTDAAQAVDHDDISESGEVPTAQSVQRVD